MTLVQTASAADVPRRSLKHLLNLVAFCLVAPAALTCAIERRFGGQSQNCFVFWTQVVAMLPGLGGLFLRRAFYRWTLEGCAESVTIGFGTVFSRRTAVLEPGVYVGAYALVGSVWIGENSLIGSRTSLLSGGRQHEWLPSGRWSATDEQNLQRIEIGPNTWVGEGAILMANVGAGCMVAAGAVVSSPVPSGVVVAGNPARFVRRLGEQHDLE
jgi:carbonic anhydrase/acetyltransferase-like protein (isoleucine patch superfamily)